MWGGEYTLDWDSCDETRVAQGKKFSRRTTMQERKKREITPLSSQNKVNMRVCCTIVRLGWWLVAFRVMDFGILSAFPFPHFALVYTITKLEYAVVNSKRQRNCKF